MWILGKFGCGRLCFQLNSDGLCWILVFVHKVGNFWVDGFRSFCFCEVNRANGGCFRG